MIDNEFETIGLYEHNADSYKKVKEAYESGEDVVGIVHATGTGKSYNALQLAYDNKDKKIIYVVPSSGIIEHIKEIIENNPKLDLKRDFPNLEFRTYQSFISLSEDEITDINCDLLILDEFHHIGAPVWGARVNTMIETHPNMKVFGMTAYTVRDRGTAYERDMANPDTDELFSNRIESRYDICDAMLDGVLPKPIYKSAYINLLSVEEELEKKVQKLGENHRDYNTCMSLLNDVKKRIHEAPSIPELLKRNIKPNGKYIYFCPPVTEDGINDIETIKKQAMEWFLNIVPEEDIMFYTSTSDMGTEGKRNRNAFYYDQDLEGNSVNNKLKVMFAINQYNEGIHAPNIDGVIMGRATTSDIVYFEQLGRALAVRGNTKDKFEMFEKHSMEVLQTLCKQRDIPLPEGISKEEIIEKLIAPTIIDLTNNYEFIEDLENNLKDRIKLYEKGDLQGHRDIVLKDALFDIELLNRDLYQMLQYVMDKITMTWEDYYELAQAYYNKHGNLKIPFDFKTINGYDYNEKGIKLGSWIIMQRQAFRGKDNWKITPEQIKKLEDIGMVFENVNDNRWNEMYALAQAYYEHHGDLLIPGSFITINGYDYDENGVRLGEWIIRQRQAFNGTVRFKITPEQIKKLEDIGMLFENVNDNRWNEMYALAKAYYEHHGNLLIPDSFKTTNGYDYNENGVRLGKWLSSQRQLFNGTIRGKMTPERIKQLEDIGMVFENVNDKNWNEMYALAKAYYEHHGDLLIPGSFITINGYDYDENGKALGQWINRQRQAFKDKGTYKITPEQIKQLEDIGMVFENVNDKNWNEMYALAKAYYEHHGDLDILRKFRTKNGYEYDENGKALGQWIADQQKKINGIVTSGNNLDRIKQLKDIGIITGNVNDNRWNEMYALAKKYYEHHGNLKVPLDFKTTNGYEYDENGNNLGLWINTNRLVFSGSRNGNVNYNKIKLLNDIEMIWILDKKERRLQEEEITSENLERKKTEIQNRFYSVLTKKDQNSLPSKEELNQDFLDSLESNKKQI